MARETPESEQLIPVIQMVLQKYAYTYSELAHILGISVEHLMRLAQGQGELTPKQLARLQRETNIDQRFWARWQQNHHAQTSK